MSKLICRREQGPGFSMSLRRYEPGEVQRWHSHDYFGISMVVQGQVFEESPSSSHTAGPCEIVHKPAGISHENRFGPHGATLLAIELPSLSTRIDNERSETSAYSWQLSPHLIAPMVRLLGDIAAKDEREAPKTDTTESSHFDDLVVEILASKEEPHPQSSENQAIGRVIGLMRDSISTPLRVQDLAADVGLHPVYLARVFRKRLGTSLSEYRQRLRVEAAIRHISRTTDPLSTIALACGFSDQSHLSRTMRHWVGLSPAAFRRRLLEPLDTNPGKLRKG